MTKFSTKNVSISELYRLEHDANEMAGEYEEQLALAVAETNAAMAREMKHREDLKAMRKFERQITRAIQYRRAKEAVAEQAAKVGELRKYARLPRVSVRW